jgi:DNA-directed RNA polymerase specialized sigma24 family protein
MISCNAINSIALDVEPGAMADELLVAAAQGGREWAFTELCKRNSKRVFSTVYRVTKNREDAEDALQDATMRAFLHLDKFDGRSSFATWFTRVAINSALMILRKKRFVQKSRWIRTRKESPGRRYKLRITPRTLRSFTRDAKGPST